MASSNMGRAQSQMSMPSEDALAVTASLMRNQNKYSSIANLKKENTVEKKSISILKKETGE